MKLSAREAAVLVLLSGAALFQGPHVSVAQTTGQVLGMAALVMVGIYLNRKRKAHT